MWRWRVSFTSWSLYPRERRPWYPLVRRPGGPQSWSWRGGEEKKFLPCQKSNPGLARILVPTLIGLQVPKCCRPTVEENSIMIEYHCVSSIQLVPDLGTCSIYNPFSFSFFLTQQSHSGLGLSYWWGVQTLFRQAVGLFVWDIRPSYLVQMTSEIIWRNYFNFRGYKSSNELGTWLWIGKDLLEDGRDRHFMKRMRQNTSVRTARNLAETRIAILLNTNTERYRYTNLLRLPLYK
jgi:hypothetical protein